MQLELQSQPESLALVRGALSGIGEALAFDLELLDDVKTAVSEACNNVVLHAYPNGTGPLLVAVRVGEETVTATVGDRGSGIHGVASGEDRMGIGLALISALTERAEFIAAPEGGTEVRMTFKGRIGRSAVGSARLPAAAEEEETPSGVEGDVMVNVSPPALIGDVLGRLARGLAGVARFSVDRLSDLHLVVDALAAHARAEASNSRISVGLTATQRQLEVVIGPFHSGSSEHLRRNAHALTLADEVRIEPTDESEILRVIVTDTRRSQ